MIKKIKTFFSSRRYKYEAYARVYSLNYYKKFVYAISGRKSKILFEKEYNGENILLLALFEKSIIRPDILRLCQEAKKQGMYVLAVNTLKISEVSGLKDYMDCYIERMNFGRDFGSYKEGFLHIYKREWHKNASRIIMMNDSVFYSKKHLPNFLKVLKDTKYKALGATENFELSYHLGSFCISISGDVIRNKKFIKYWKKYKLSEIRPIVIRKGEMALTKTLIGCVGSNMVAAAYSASEFEEWLKDDNNLDYALKIRTRDKTPWKKIYVNEIVDKFIKDFCEEIYNIEDRISFRKTKMDDLGKMYEGGTALLRSKMLASFEDIANYLSEKYGVNLSDERKNVLRRYVVGYLIDIYMSGSQIHRNAPILLQMGCAIVKLDGLYRGAFDNVTVQYILENMEEDGEELKKLLSRPFGGEILNRWKLAAFNQGII